MLSCLEVAACQVLNASFLFFSCWLRFHGVSLDTHRIKPPTVSQCHALLKRTVLKVEDTHNCYGLDLKSSLKANQWRFGPQNETSLRIGMNSEGNIKTSVSSSFLYFLSSVKWAVHSIPLWKLKIHESNRILIFVSWWSQLFISVTKPDQLVAHHQCLNLPFLDCLGIPQSLVSACRKTKTLVLESPSPGTLSCLLLKLERNVVYISSETLAKKS